MRHLLPEYGPRRRFKHAVLDTVVCWALDCGHRIVAKEIWMEYAANGITKNELICPYCKNVNPNLIYMIPSGLSLVVFRGIDTKDIRYWQMAQQCQV
jgi:hypothetical protein